MLCLGHDDFHAPGAEATRRRTLPVDLEPGPPTLPGALN